jgi:hypothetical protein
MMKKGVAEREARCVMNLFSIRYKLISGTLADIGCTTAKKCSHLLIKEIKDHLL